MTATTHITPWEPIKPTTSSETTPPYVLSKTPLGDGSYSVVYECKNTTTNRHYAAKKYKKRLMYGNEAQLRNEFIILKQISLSNNHLLSLLDHFETRDNYYLVTDLARGGDLWHRVTDNEGSSTDVRKVTRQLVGAVEFLHAHGIVHRDIKAENVFFQSRDGDDILLGDFGLAKVLKPSEKLHEVCGTLSYMAPEMFDREVGYEFGVDVWAIGVTVYFMLGKYLPFDCDDDDETKDAIKGCKYLFEPADYWEEVGISADAKNFVISCLSVDSDKRPKCDQLLHHPFLKPTNKKLKKSLFKRSFTNISALQKDQIANIMTRTPSMTSLIPPPLSHSSSINDVLLRGRFDSVHNEHALLNGAMCPSPECVTVFTSPVSSNHVSRESSTMNIFDEIAKPSENSLAVNSVQRKTAKFAYKPREETDFKEIYPDLDDLKPLPIFITGDTTNTIDDNEDDDDIMEIRSSTNTQPNHVNFVELKKPNFKKTAMSSLSTTPHLRFNKQLLEYGFQNPSKFITSKSTTHDTYIRPFDLPNSTSSNSDQIERLIEKKKNLVEYDMDEQDYLFLQDRNNSTENVIKITPEVFEIMMTSLENQWDDLEHRMTSVASNSGNSWNNDIDNWKMLTMGHNNAKYGNDDGIVPGSIYDQKCAVCNDSDCDNANAIVFCDGCDIAVHQECYGVAFIPEGQWLCRKCMINNKNRTTQCVFCPSTTGAFKQLDNSLWSHVICALWINELYFASPIYMEPIEGMDNIPKNRWKLTCYICKLRVGACIQCCNRSCFQAYHVTCGKRAGLYMKMTQGLKGALANKLTLKTFCEKHSPVGSISETSVLKGIDRTRAYYRDTKLLNEKNAKLRKDRKTANKLNIFKWKTESNTPIAPKMFSDELVSILYKLKVENQISLPEESTNQVLDLNVLPNRSKFEINQDMKKIADEMCRYWCLKRESKRGAPLIRKNNNLISTSSILYDSTGASNTYGSSDCTKKLEFAELLVKDIENLTNIGHELLKRQELSKTVDEMSFDTVDFVYFPLKKAIDDVLIRLNNKYDPQDPIVNKPKSILSGLLNEVYMKNMTYGYKSVPELETDLADLQQKIFHEYKPSSNIYKKYKNWYQDFQNHELPQLKYHFATDQQRENNVGFKMNSLMTIDSLHQINLDGLNTTVEPYDYHAVLKENDLSEIEDDDVDEMEMKKEIFEKFLHGN
ncbi:NTO1 NuA3 HAT complex component NTO1 [Candida maltosa Xu316]